MNVRILASFVFALPFRAAFLLAAACGGNEPTPTTAATPASTATVTAAATSAAPATTVAPATTATAVAVTAPVATTFKEATTKDAQIAFMKAHIMPAMGPVFALEDGADKHPAFSCKTCHGPNFVEPKAFLPHLTMKDGKITAFATKPKVAAFMLEKVTPAMATAMGEKPFDPATKQGFGCMGCHTVDMK